MAIDRSSVHHPVMEVVMNNAWHTLTDLRRLIDRKEASALEITDGYLARIERAENTLHAFTEVFHDAARALARAADAAQASGLPMGPLHGLPIVLKDLLDIEGRICTFGSKHYASRVSPVTAATVERLFAAGMVPLGKVHMTEFAFGGWGTNANMGAPRNPWDLAVHRVPGGSSSGTGVAVAAGLAPAGIGSDTGGSVRIPCAFNGLTGLKVTHGRISLHGTGLLSWSLDTIGPMARSVQDCALLLDAMAAPDARDPTTLSQPLEHFARDPQSVRGLRLALPDTTGFPDFVDHGVAAAWQSAARTFEALGAQVLPVRLPAGFLDLAAAAGVVITAEAYALHGALAEDDTSRINPVVRKRLQMAKRYGPVDYTQALRTMAQRRAEFMDWFASYDAILLPCVAIPAIALDDVDESSPIPGFFTRPANYLGLCALAQPSGLVNGLPVGIQIVGKPYAERTVMSLGQAFETATGSHLRHPDLSAIGLP
jgi:aspartyl-tRNA(Asn)/glutamyl-tRNA(Gln) amidotransferase subunit A